MTVPQESLLEHFSKSFHEPFCDSNCIDVPRLVRRLEIRCSRGLLHPRTSQDMEGSVVNVLISAIVVVVKHFEGETTADEIREALQRVDYTDMEPVTIAKEMFAIVGVNSKTAKVFKQLNQGVVLAGMSRLKATVLRSHITKDVRTSDGWLIDIWLGEGKCEVRHTRKERSVNFQHPECHWDIVWELCQSFDSDMQAITASFLRVLYVDTRNCAGESLGRELQCCGLLVE
eukprot:c6225_g1_i1.p1 GENE.c6225_g1_i1~~c6225_g1_i1.p1  ORF type:complete len:260 (-),score=35.74 c6225_g1_i1:72-761(-)